MTTDRGVEVIDSELRLLAAVREVAIEHGAHPSTDRIDELLDERGTRAQQLH